MQLEIQICECLSLTDETCDIVLPIAYRGRTASRGQLTPILLPSSITLSIPHSTESTIHNDTRHFHIDAYRCLHGHHIKSSVGMTMRLTSD